MARTLFRHSIAGRLVMVLLAVYVIITVVLTVLQMTAEFHGTKNSVLEELENMGRAVSNGLAAALYNVDDEQVNAILSGVVASSSILALRVQRQFLPDITLSSSQGFMETDENSFSRDKDFLFTVSLPYKQLDGSMVNVGRLTLLSSPDIVFGKMRTGIFSILWASAIKLLVVCLVILLISRWMVSRPIEELTRAVTRISMETLDSGRVHIRSRGISELRTLQDAFNAMLGRLGEHRTAREQAEEKYRGIFQNAVEGIFRATPEGRFVDVNPSMARMLLYDSPEDMIDCIVDISRDIYVTAEDRVRSLEQMRKGQNVTGFEVRIHRKDRSVIWVSFNLRPILNSKGELELIEGMGTDITERKEAENAMRRAKEAAEQASRLKSDFISMVTHELRTPMTSVLGFAQMISKKFQSAIIPRLPSEDPAVSRAVKQVTDNLAVIVHEGRRLSQLISDVLDLSRMESGNMTLNRTQVNLSQALDTAVATVGPLLAEKNLSFSKREDPELPLVKADEDRIVQVFINLLANAVKFTESGGVTCILWRDEAHIRVSIQDTGPGIPLEDQKDIFSKFKQLGDTLTDRPQGTGLGLAICKEIVEQHHGRIYLESAPGKGSTFVFLLPL